MKVLVVNTVSFSRNGITGVILNLFKHIDETKVQMDFVATDYNTEQWVRDTISMNGSSLFEINKRYSRIFEYVIALSKVAKGYDAIHVHGNSSSMAFELLAAKIVGVKKCIAHSHNTTCGSPKLDMMLRPLFHTLCNGRVACGEDAGKWMFGTRDFVVVNNGIDCEKYRFCKEKRINQREKHGFTNELIVGHVGRFNDQKNQIFLLDIFSEIEKNIDYARLILIGDGPLKEELMVKTKMLGIENKALFLGAVDNVNEYLNAIDLIVMPSKYEGLPLTLVEEQANGLTCLCASTITKESNITGNVQFMDINDSSYNWAQKIYELTDKIVTDDRKKNSQNSIEEIRNKGFDIHTSVKILENLYCDR